jgi:hypothetical protein
VPLSTSDFAGDGDPPSKLQAPIDIREERELRTVAPVAGEVELIRISPKSLYRSAVCGIFSRI